MTFKNSLLDKTGEATGWLRGYGAKQRAFGMKTFVFFFFTGIKVTAKTNQSQLILKK